ncbi:MAG TPA: ABC transporter ATP-binding protein [Thermoleophilaceae bacterium]|nr:ABC transporter ATP-binding protein [Thermoleophilaceae bacterium]
MTTFWRLLGFLRPYRRGVILSFLLAGAAMGVSVLVPYLVGRTVDDIGKEGANLWPLALAVAGAGVLRLVFSVARRIVAGTVSLGVEYDLRNRMYQHLQSLELAFFDGQQTGQLMSRATVDLQSVRFFLGYGLIFLVQSVITIVIAAVVMFALDPGLAAVALAPTPFVVWIAYRYGTRNRPATQEVQQRIAELTAEAEENIGGVRVVKAFAQEPRQLRRFSGTVARVFEQSMISTRLRAFYSPFIGFLPQLGLAALLLVGGRQAVNGSITVGEFIAFYGYVLMLTGPMRGLGMALGMAQRAVASGARVFELLDREPRLVAAPDAIPLPPGGGRVELRNVSFGYDGTELVLHGIDLDVEPGRTVAIVGPTGSGKTTLVMLIPRLYDVTEGALLVDGVDVRELDPASLRREVAVVSDDAFLFSASLGDNIAYARPDASEQQIVDAAERAGLAELLEELPEGLDTMVGERGLTLSGGQRQRVAIARALIAEPRILILDDATSSVDATTENRIKSALGEVMTGRTTFVIAHRLSTIALADEVVVLEAGEIVARGTHTELLESSPLYREIAEKGLPDQVFLTRDDPEREVAGL